MQGFSFRPAAVCAGLILFLAIVSPLSVVEADEIPAGTITVAVENADAGNAGGAFLSAVSAYVQDLAGQLSEAGQMLLAVPELVRTLLLKARDPQILASAGGAAGKVLLVLGLGIAAGLLSRLLLGRLRRRAEDRETDPLLNRVLSLIGRALVDAVPVVAFAVTAWVVLPLAEPRHETRQIALALINAGILVHLILIASRLALMPGAPALRPTAMSEESVYYLYTWIRRLAGTGIYGYFILEAARIMGMPAAPHTLLMNLLGLIVTVMLMMLVMQNKKEVAAWILRDPAGPDKDTGKTDHLPAALHGADLFRRRWAEVWHVAAILLIIGFFVIWTLEIEGGPAFLFHGTIMTLLVLVPAALLIRLTHHGVNRLFEISPELKITYPGLEERVNRYQPFLRKTLKIVIQVVAVFAVAEVWGLDALGRLFSPAVAMVAGELATMALIIAGAFLLWEIFSAVVERALARGEGTDGATRRMTLLPLLKNVVRITLVVVVSMLLLSQLGLNIGPLIAGAGVIGLAVGFGAQTLVRDVITGAFILFENAISVGDWVEAGGYSGTVERLTVRTVTLRDLAGTVHLVPYGDVTTVTNYNRDYGYVLVDARVAHRENYGDVVQALQDVAVDLRRDETWGPDITGDLEVFGMNNLDDSSVEIRVRMKTRPMRQFAVRRVFLERMKCVFDERGIEIPFPHRTIWFGADKDGTAPPAFHAAVEKKPAGDSGGETTGEKSRINIASESEASAEVVQDTESETRPA